MPTYRSDLMSIPRYVPGKPVAEVARERGLTSVDKLASNECPTEPFPEVVAAIAASASGVNRYPDTGAYHVRHALAAHHGVDPSEVWVGAGSSDVLRSVAMSVGGLGTSAVFSDPSFVLYPITTRICAAEPIAVPLGAGYRQDLDAIASAIRGDTTLVYLCNPNNPTGGHLSGSDVRGFIDAMPSSIVVIVDEAYAEYVTADDYESMIGEASGWPNVLVLRTFSKIYGLAGLRIGYGIGDADLIANAQRTQAPFAVTSVAQHAAIEALRHQDRVKQRAKDNAAARQYLLDELTARGLAPAPSQANFVYFEPESAVAVSDDLLSRGIIVRRLGPGIRVSVGTGAENERFVQALDAVIGS